MSGDISAFNRLFIANDASLNGNVFVKKNLNLKGNPYIKSYAANATVYSVGYQFVAMNDVSLSGRLYAMNDVSLNNRLFMGSDVSMNQRLFISADLSAGGTVKGQTATVSTINVGSDLIMNFSSNQVVHQFGTAVNAIPPTPPASFVNLSNYAQYSTTNSMNLGGGLYVSSDISLNSRLFVAGDASMTAKLFANSDVSMNQRLYVNSDVLMNQRLFTLGDVSMNKSLFINGDVSLNQRLFLNGDLSLNNNIFSTAFTSNLQNNSANIIGTVGVNNATPQYTLDVSGTVNASNGVITPGITPSTPVYQQNWAPITQLPSNSIDWNDLAMSATGQYMLVGYNTVNNGLWLSTDYGSSWSKITNAYTNGTYRGVAISGTGQYMLAATNENTGKVYFSDSYGTNLSWKQLNIGTNGLPTNGGWISATISSTGQYMILCQYNTPGNVYLSTNFGTSWSLATGLPTNSTNYFQSSISSTGQYMIVTFQSTCVYVSSNYGSTWIIQTVGIPSTNCQIGSTAISANGQYIACACNFGGMYISNNFGESWNPTGQYAGYYAGLAMSANGQYIIAGINNGAGAGVGYWFSTNYGVNWTYISVLSTMATIAIAMSKDAKYILVGNSTATSSVYLSVGTPVTTLGLNNPTPQYTLDIANNTNTQQLSTYATAPTNFGGTYSPIMDLGTAYTWTSATVSPNGQYMLVTTAGPGGVWISSNYGSTWSQTTLNSTASFSWNFGAISSTGQYMLAGGVSGGTFLSIDYGNTWNLITCLSTSLSWYGLSMSSNGQYMLASVNGTSGVYLSTNYGASTIAPYGTPGWTLISGLSTSYSYISTSMSSNGQYMITGQFNPVGSLYVSSNYGITWTQITVVAPTNVGWYQVGMSNSGQYMIAAAWGGFVYVSKDYGVTWTQTPLATATSSSQQPCSVSGTGQYMFVGNSNGAFYSVDYGLSWTKNSYLPTSTIWRFGSMSSTGQYSLQIVQNGYVYLSQGTNVTSANQVANFGANASWTNLSSVFSNGSITTCAISGTGQYMLIGTWVSVGCYLSTNYGYSFTQISTASVPTTAYYHCSAISSTGQYMILGNSSVATTTYIYLSSNYGATFSSVTMPASDYWLSAGISSTGQYMIVVSTGSNRVYISNNYGAAASWSQISTASIPSTNAFYAGAVSSTGQYMLAGANASSPLYLSTNYGVSWTASSLTSSTGFWNCKISDSGQYMMATGFGGYSYYSTNYGSTWIQTPMASSAVFINCAISSSGQYMFVGNNNGTFFSSNYGSTWSTIPNVPGNTNFRFAAMSGTGQYIMSPVYGTAGLCYTSFGTYVNVPATYTPQITNSVINQAVSQYAPQQNPGSLNINTSSAITGTNFGSANTWSTVSQLASGLTWATFMSPTGQYMMSGSQSNASGGLWWSTNYGASWAQYNTATFPTTAWWNGSAFSSTGQYMLVCGVSGTGCGVYLSSNFGQSFTMVSNTILPTANGFYGCSMSSAGQYMLAGCSNGFGNYLSSNYGVSWALITGTSLPTNAGCLMPTMSSSGQYMICAPFSIAGPVYVSSNYGVAWTAVPAANGLPSSSQYWQSATSSTGQYMIVTSGGSTSSNGYAYLSSNYGVNWSTISVAVAASPTIYAYTCAISGTGQYMYLNNYNGSYYSNNYGATWTTGSQPAYGSYRFSSMSYSGQYIITSNANSGGFTYLSTGQITGNNTSALTTATNYGMNSTWSAITAISSTAIKEGTAVSSTGQYMYTGGAGIGLWWSQNYGVTWAQNTNGVATNAAIEQIGISSTGQYVLVSCAGTGMFLSSNYGQNFAVVPNAQLPTNYTWLAAAVSGTGQYMLAGVTNVAQQSSYISSNYGVTWSAISSANIPTNIRAVSYAMSSNGQYMLTGGWDTATSLYLSSNYGANWAIIPVSAGVITTASWYQVGVSSTGQYMIAGTYMGSGATYISSNYGVSWSALQIGSGWGGNSWNACCISGTGQYMFVQNIAGSFLSNDFGANWITITALPVTSTWRQPSMSYTGQYILTQPINGQVWLSSGITGVGINNSNPQNALDIVGPMKYPTYMASGYLTNSLALTYGTGAPFTSSSGYPATLSSNGGFYIPVTGIYNLVWNASINAAAGQNWELSFYVGTTIPTGLTQASVRTNTNVIAITVREDSSYTGYSGTLRFIGKLTAGNYVWCVPTTGLNAAITTYSWGNNNGLTASNNNSFTGYLVSAL